MEEQNELPENETPETEDSKKKKSSPSAPVIETPVPPQVMDPSAPPEIQREKPFATPSKRTKKPSKRSRQAR